MMPKLGVGNNAGCMVVEAGGENLLLGGHLGRHVPVWLLLLLLLSLSLER